MIFAVSPINSEPVIWISASKVTIYALFYLLAIQEYICYIITNKGKCFYLAIVYFVLSFGAKEQAVVFPACMVLLDYFFGRNLRDKNLWLEKMPVAVLALLFGIASLQSQGNYILDGGKFYPITERFLLSAYTMWEYLMKIIIPINISYVYPYPYLIGQEIPFSMFVYPVGLVVIFICMRKCFSDKWILFGFVFFLIHIFIVLNLFSIARYSVIADRYAYVSSIGIYLILARLFVTAYHHVKINSLAILLGVLYLLYFISYTNIHSGIATIK